MVPALSLWLPVLLAAVFVFLVSSVIHMVLQFWHRNDFRGLPQEDAVMDALRPLDLPRGDYMIPHAGSSAAMKDPAFKDRLERGPVAIVTVMTGDYQMGKSLLQWFLYCVLVGLFAAYVTGRALGPGASYLEVFRFAGTVSFGGYALALMQGSIWYKRQWSSTIKSMIDGFVYALVTAGTFGWLWPA